MFKKHIIFQILYIIVGPLCPASLKRFIFYKVPPSDYHSLLWLASWPSALWLAEHRKGLKNGWDAFVRLESRSRKALEKQSFPRLGTLSTRFFFFFLKQETVRHSRYMVWLIFT